MLSDRQTTGWTAGHPMLRQTPPPPRPNFVGRIKHAARLLVCITLKTVVLIDILRQMVQKSGFTMLLWSYWRPSWISQLAEGNLLSVWYSL